MSTAETAETKDTTALTDKRIGPAPSPGLILLCALFIGLAAGWLTIATSVNRPWLGFDLKIDQSADALILEAPIPHSPAALSDIAAGVRITDIEAGSDPWSPGLPPALALGAMDLVEEPDSLDSYDDIARFLERQSHISDIIQHDIVRLHVTNPATQARTVTDVEPRWRPIWSLPVAFWVQLLSGLVGFWTGAWVWSLRRNDLASRMFALSGAGLMLSALPAAIYSTRELAIEGQLFALLSALNHTGVHVFGGALIALFLVYPRRLIPLTWLVALPLVLGFWLWADVSRVLPNPAVGMYVPMLAEMAAIIALVVVQAGCVKSSPTERAALRWLGLSAVVGAGAFVVGIALPLLLGEEPFLSQGFAFAFFLIVYGGIALGIRRYRLFDLGEWSFRILFYVFGAVLLLILDAALIWLLNVGRAPAFGASLLIVAFFYLPFREAMHHRITGKRDIARDELFASAMEVAFAATPAQRLECWRRLLARLYDPLEIATAHEAPDAVQASADGIEMAFPAVAGFPPLRLRYPKAGIGLFGAIDLRLARELVTLIGKAVDSRDAYERGALEERQRIARDLHDDVGGRLLTGMHSVDLRTRQILQASLSDIRSIISGLNGEKVALAQALADARHEAARRLEAASIALDWPPAEGAAERIVLDYSQAKALTSSVREIVTNIIRHAGATSVEAKLSIGENVLCVSISDDGKGFSEMTVEGYGLRNIRQRAETLGGDVSIRSDADGTTVAVSLAC